jgi:hypothetical protein
LYHRTLAPLIGAQCYNPSSGLPESRPFKPVADEQCFCHLDQSAMPLIAVCKLLIQYGLLPESLARQGICHFAVAQVAD